ncbi:MULTISPECIES: tRNA 2-thiouridine(34) synthase MnmA [unclassified Microbacterium]|uniref:tRNA 2-thiouridine(34) synthase MnmA n=1 Tax=unclassified Microbacterium TaxID=2609290 RepID=UPI00214CC681|nr:MULTISPECIES: tRNA 2-thiouridine(34) synthase MnmA [unclassified Microbacterium]MCR2785462.1 tRNA 2-thiouridine(34) synthase MnmA [Microbacterium sp. zg.B96]WIM14512.1 tRNA 2-thiouridine(34) synthase MnmA [Microbacterium sp. zg-B96]
MRVLAAMSGGVDSAVAAARAVDAGHEVVGVHLALSRAGGTLRAGSRGCCTIEDALDARRAADRLGIPFYVWDFSERFRDDVVADFISEYQAGRTPNPCMRCNEKIKFAALLERALELGFDAVCTGHYATLVDGPNGRELHRASDAAKDQSYVLGVLTAEQLAHTYFPLGSTPSKALVRAEAEQRGLTVAQKPDSHDICFIPDGDTRGWLAERVGAETGEILDRTGAVVGTHEGAHAFTVGQRRGLKLGMPASDGKPRFVLEVRPVSNTVVVGPKEALATAQISGERFTWAGHPPTTDAFDCHAQIRAHADPVPARAELADGTLTVTPHEPFEGVAPGQTAVLYDGTRVLGQFTIDRTVSAVPVTV